MDKDDYVEWLLSQLSDGEKAEAEAYESEYWQPIDCDELPF